MAGESRPVVRAEAADAISAIPAVTARNLQGGKLALLPYGNRAGLYTQIDARATHRRAAGGRQRRVAASNHAAEQPGTLSCPVAGHHTYPGRHSGGPDGTVALEGATLRVWAPIVYRSSGIPRFPLPRGRSGA